MKTQIKTITPALAAQYLKKNTANRKLRTTVVAKYANDMRNGNWFLTHQGIAFMESGELVDGQHRLEAVVQSGASVDMLVSFGLANESTSSGLSSMDGMDRCLPRSVGDQLSRNHGYENANLFAACCASIAAICIGLLSRANGMTVSTTVQIADEFKDSLFYAIEERSQKKGLRAASVIGSVAFARDANPRVVEPFYQSLVNGEGLKKGDPVYALREYLLGPTSTTGGATSRARTVAALFNALDMYAENKSSKSVRFSMCGLDKWIAKQQVKVAKVRSLFGLNNS